MNKHTIITILICLASLVCIPGYLTASEQTGQSSGHSGTAILVIAPDRGFSGNEQVREAFSRIVHENKSLVFITDGRSKSYLDRAVAELSARDSRELTVLPLFISDRRPAWRLAYGWLMEDACNKRIRCRFSKPFGQSYLAVDVLEQSIRDVGEPGQKHLVLIGYGADNEAASKIMAQDWQHIINRTGYGHKFRSVTTMVWNPGDRAGEAERLKQLAARGDTAFISFHLGKNLDSMMNFNAGLRSDLPDEAAGGLHTAKIDSGIMGLWIQRETNRSLIQGVSDIGVIVHAHGSDFLWNQTMREALASLNSRYTIEYAFSMADRPTIEAALSRLQQRGMKGAVIVRVFGRKNSFQDTIEKMIGMDVESAAAGHNHGQHAGHHMGSDHGMMGGRIRTPLVVTSVGGLEDHPLFAQALLDRAVELSRDPQKETIILVAHGTGDDGQNTAWMKILERLAGHMRKLGGNQFRDIKFATWREDWPDKRGEWIAKVRDMVKEAGKNNGTAIVIPARTNAVGPEDEFLEGLDYKLGRGFAPHPLFAHWMETQILDGNAKLTEHKHD